VVETIRLESGHTLTGIGGSNPSLSARCYPYLSPAFARSNCSTLKTPIWVLRYQTAGTALRKLRSNCRVSPKKTPPFSGGVMFRYGFFGYCDMSFTPWGTRAFAQGT
jgi:hypothetical protein